MSSLDLYLPFSVLQRRNKKVPRAKQEMCIVRSKDAQMLLTISLMEYKRQFEAVV